MKKNSKSILEAYTPLLGFKLINKLKKKAQKFKGKTVLHVNATKFGGGVAEILQNMIPLMKELGIEAKSVYLPTGAWSDYMPVVKHGFEACWIGSQPGLKYVHTKKDNMSLVSKEGLKNALLLTIEVVNKINNEFN